MLCALRRPRKEPNQQHHQKQQNSEREKQPTDATFVAESQQYFTNMYYLHTRVTLNVS